MDFQRLDMRPDCTSYLSLAREAMIVNYPNATSLMGTLLLCAVGWAGCSSTDQSQIAVGMVQSPQPSDPESRSGAQKAQGLISKNLRQGQDKSSLDALRQGNLATTPAGSALKEIYFDFDSYRLSTDARSTLQIAANWLKKNLAVRVEIEGHCDERGTSEYNLALGAKRAQVAKDYLMALGIAPNRISTTSYGEEIPVCREHRENCWQKNRRDRFVTLTSTLGI